MFYIPESTRSITKKFSLGLYGRVLWLTLPDDFLLASNDLWNHEIG